MNFFDYLQKQATHETPSEKTDSHRKPISSHLRILVLAIELQKWNRMIKCNSRSTSRRITHHRLVSDYYESGFCSSEGAAYKMATRDLKYLNLIFGITGNNKAGLGMRKDFPSYRDLLIFWLDTLGEPNKSDRRMHVMLAGLIEAIDNGFRDDPIVVSTLAKKLKERFGNKNPRDSLQPLSEMFGHHLIAFYLDLDEEDDGSLHIHDCNDAMLMRLRPRSEIGDNADVSVILAMPGKIHPDFEQYTNRSTAQEQNKLIHIAKAVYETHAWKDNETTMLVPYILYLKKKDTPPILTLWQASDGHYRDVDCSAITSVPKHGTARYSPLGMPDRLWYRFQGVGR